MYISSQFHKEGSFNDDRLNKYEGIFQYLYVALHWVLKKREEIQIAKGRLTVNRYFTFD